MEKNEIEAVNWFRKAAEAGFPYAQRNLGSCYQSGSGLKQDNAKAFKWYRESALNGLPEGQFCLAYCYSQGWGVKKSDAEAIKWYQESALNGLPEGQYIMGLSYKNGRVVKKDPVEAFAYFNLASDKHEDAPKERDLIEGQLTKEQKALGQRRTKELQAQIKDRTENK